MHDIRFIRENRDAFDAGLARRGLPPQADDLIALDSAIRREKTAMQEGLARKNELSKEFGNFKRQGLTPPADLQAELESLKHNLPQGEREVEKLSAELKAALEIIPNLPAADVPDGSGEEDNVLVPIKSEDANEDGTWGQKRTFDFPPREHADIAPALGMDFETGTRLSGARFTFLRGGMARLHRALGQFMLDVQTGEHGYAECNPPVLVGDDAMYGTDKLPKFAGDSFQTNISYVNWLNSMIDRMTDEVVEENPKVLGELGEEGVKRATDRVREKWLADFAKPELTRRWLIPTSEVSLTASVMGELLDEAALPMRLTALTLCFRSEAGAAGRDTRGFIRQHQFEKCELVSIVRPEDSEKEHDRMVLAAQSILEKLNLPYRKLLLCTGDMGFGARKTYDLEVWLPGQGAYREISSCSNTGDFQARRMNTRYRVAGEKRTEFVHTLNGSGLAVGRTLVAVIENYQNADGSVTVPDALLPYMGGLEIIRPN